MKQQDITNFEKAIKALKREFKDVKPAKSYAEAKRRIEKADKIFDKYLTKKEKKLLRKKPWLYRENKKKKINNPKNFFDYAEGPRISSLKIQKLDKKTGKAKESIYLGRVYGFGHSPLFLDEYTGKVTFAPSRMNKKHREQWKDEFLPDFWRSREIFNGYEITVAWYQGVLPMNFFKPRKLKSQNFEIEINDWSGTIVLTLKDYRTSFPFTTWAIITVIGIVGIVLAITLPILNAQQVLEHIPTLP